jgi:hypothetical protein
LGAFSSLISQSDHAIQEVISRNSMFLPEDRT